MSLDLKAEVRVRDVEFGDIGKQYLQPWDLMNLLKERM
jgi:hypothetical protein